MVLIWRPARRARPLTGRVRPSAFMALGSRPRARSCSRLLPAAAGRRAAASLPASARRAAAAVRAPAEPGGPAHHGRQPAARRRRDPGRALLLDGLGGPRGQRHAHRRRGHRRGRSRRSRCPGASGGVAMDPTRRRRLRLGDRRRRDRRADAGTAGPRRRPALGLRLRPARATPAWSAGSRVPAPALRLPVQNFPRRRSPTRVGWPQISPCRRTAHRSWCPLNLAGAAAVVDTRSGRVRYVATGALSLRRGVLPGVAPGWSPTRRRGRCRCRPPPRPQGPRPRGRPPLVASDGDRAGPGGPARVRHADQHRRVASWTPAGCGCCAASRCAAPPGSARTRSLPR